MFTHHVALTLKADSTAALTRQVKKQILPILQAQKGFCQEITIIAPDRLTAVMESSWKTLEDAKNYNRTAYLDVLRIFSEVVTTLPKARTFKSLKTNSWQIHKKAA